MMIVKSEFAPHSSDYQCQNQVKNHGSVSAEQLVLKSTSLEGRLLAGLDSTDDEQKNEDDEQKSEDDGQKSEDGDRSNSLKDAGDDGVNYLTGLNKD